MEKTTTGYSAYAEKYGVITTGADLKELKENMVDAINLYFEEMEEKAATANDLTYKIDLKSFFDLYPVLNAAALAQRVGMNKALLSQYTTGKKKASEAQLKRIVEGAREVGKELMSVADIF